MTKKQIAQVLRDRYTYNVKALGEAMRGENDEASARFDARLLELDRTRVALGISDTLWWKYATS